MNTHSFKYKAVFCLLTCISLVSCKGFLEVGPPVDSITTPLVFNNDDAAKSAMLGIYSNMANDGFASGAINSVTALTGLCADETVNYNSSYNNFYNNALLAGSDINPWEFIYNKIYATNAILEGISNNPNLTAPLKRQLEGESKFVRAFCYFYLTNLYGDVPLNLNTDFRVNALKTKTSQDQIYQQIITDLKEAQTLLTDQYYSSERVRPNKVAATALLARVYLYTKQYALAESTANGVISNTSLYTLKDDLSQVFLKNSTEAIWQLQPNVNGLNTNEGDLFIIQVNPTGVSLIPDLVNAFDDSDQRKNKWIGQITIESNTYYFPYKYKIRSANSTGTLQEYSMVLRLAEQYLIRAEARINQNKIELGIEDLNILRQRARPNPSPNVPNPLSPIPSSLSQTDALLAVEKERRLEMFCEWGHRWFDLKRTNRADAVIPLLKSNWKSTHQLWPIPQADLNNNSSLTQNPGYAVQ